MMGLKLNFRPSLRKCFGDLVVEEPILDLNALLLPMD